MSSHSLLANLVSANIALYLLQVFANIMQGNQRRIRLCCELQISCRLSVLFFFPHPEYLGGCSFIMGNPIRNSMKHLEMSQQNLDEWVRKASPADSVLVTAFLSGFITETIQKTRTIAGRTPRLCSSPQDENI